MHSTLTGTVSSVAKNSSGGVDVSVEVEGMAAALLVPMPAEKAKSLGIGVEVDLIIKRKRKPRVEVAAVAGEEAATNGEAAAPTRGRRRAARVEGEAVS